MTLQHRAIAREPLSLATVYNTLHQFTQAGLLRQLADAAPQAEVVLVHAGASELSRLFSHRAVRPVLLAYLNRLSDALFVAARLIARRQGCGEILWQPAAAAAGADD